MSDLEQEFRALGESYERVVAAAAEARRINAVRIYGGADVDGKVTTEAMRRMVNGEVDWEIAEKGVESLPAEEAEAADVSAGEAAGESELAD